MHSPIGRRLLPWCLLVVLGAPFVPGTQAVAQPQEEPDPQAPQAARAQEAAPQRPLLPGWRSGLDYVYVRIADAIEEEGAEPGWRKLARQGGVPIDDAGRVFVYVDANARVLTYNDGELVNPPQEIPRRLRASLQQMFPGLVYRPSTATTRFWAWLPPEHVPPMFEALRERLPNVVVQRPERPLPATPGFGTVVSEGVFAMELDAYHELSVRGGDIPTAIIDLEFGGIEDFASEAGPFQHHPTQDDLNDDPGSHGTACLELFRDAAPSIGPVYAVREGSNLDIQSIVSWLVQRSPQPKVLSHSTAYFGYPGNGSVADAARAAVTAGMIWVVAAGNFADQRYWEADEPSFSNDFVQFNPGGSLNAIDTQSGQSEVVAVFSYERPDSAYAQLRVLLYEDNGSGLQVVDAGSGAAQGQVVSAPRTPGASYYLAVERLDSGPVARMRLQAADGNSRFADWVAEGSMSNPAAVADSRVVSVGAVPVTSYDSNATPASYSSQGGGIFNLQLSYCGPTNTTTASNGPFGGTSASTPHVAGLIATKLSHAPFADEVLDYVGVIDIQASGYDPRSGEGLAVADVPALQGTLPDPNEPNDTIEEATNLGTDPRRPSKGRNLSIYPVGDIDWFRFRVSERAPVRVEITGPEPATMRLRLYNDEEELLAEAVDEFPKIEGTRSAGVYYVEVREASDAETVANYTLNVLVRIDSGGCTATTQPDPSRDVGTLMTLAFILLLTAIMRRTQHAK